MGGGAAEACDVTDVTKHGRHLGFCLTCKITRINKYFASFHSQDLLLSLKEVEKHAFSLKNGLTIGYFSDVISRNKSNWLSQILSQNVRQWKTNTYWKRQGLMFDRLGKTLEKRKGGWLPPPPSLYVRGLTFRPPFPRKFFLLSFVRKTGYSSHDISDIFSSLSKRLSLRYIHSLRI